MHLRSKEGETEKKREEERQGDKNDRKREKEWKVLKLYSIITMFLLNIRIPFIVLFNHMIILFNSLIM